MQPVSVSFEAHGVVEAVECDAAFIEHMAAGERDYAKHAVSPQEIAEVLAEAPAFLENVGKENAGKRRAPIVMIGPALSGRMLLAPLEPTSRRGVWRAVTAFEPNAHDRKRYEEEMANG